MGRLSRWERVVAAFVTHVRERGNEPRFFAALAFLISWIAVRIVTHSIRADLGPLGNVQVGGLHIHHMVPGLVLLLLSGVLGLVESVPRVRAVLFGVGAALVLDEFALILNLADVYWAPQGRESIDAVVIFLSVLLVVALGGGFWRAAWRDVRAL